MYDHKVKCKYNSYNVKCKYKIGDKVKIDFWNIQDLFDSSDEYEYYLTKWGIFDELNDVVFIEGIINYIVFCLSDEHKDIYPMYRISINNTEDFIIVLEEDIIGKVDN